MKGQIIRINSDLYTVSSDGATFSCKCRGKFRKEKIIPLVGDYVLFNKDKLLIEEVLPRVNGFRRPKVANIDQAFIITSLKIPNFSDNLLDKLIVLMEMNDVVPIICITKEDLMDSNELDDIYKILDYYKSIGYLVLSNNDTDEILKLVENKTSVFVGQTGAGKSSLLNKLNPNWKLEVGEVSQALGRGKHTTRVVELFDFCGGKLLDTPGFSSLEFSDYTKDEIKNAFVEFSDFPCIYRSCTHTKELECRVSLAVKDNNILKSRYVNYLKFIEEVK